MVMVWNALARGNGDYCAVLVVINSVLQVILYSPLAVLFVNVIGRSSDVKLVYGEAAISVLIVRIFIRYYRQNNQRTSSSVSWNPTTWWIGYKIHRNEGPGKTEIRAQVPSDIFKDHVFGIVVHDYHHIRIPGKTHFAQLGTSISGIRTDDPLLHHHVALDIRPMPLANTKEEKCKRIWLRDGRHSELYGGKQQLCEYSR